MCFNIQLHKYSFLFYFSNTSLWLYLKGWHVHPKPVTFYQNILHTVERSSKLFITVISGIREWLYIFTMLHFQSRVEKITCSFFWRLAHSKKGLSLEMYLINGHIQNAKKLFHILYHSAPKHEMSSYFFSEMGSFQQKWPFSMSLQNYISFFLISNCF